MNAGTYPPFAGRAGGGKYLARIAKALQFITGQVAARVSVDAMNQGNAPTIKIE